MRCKLTVRNRQRTRRINSRELRDTISELLGCLAIHDGELSVVLVNQKEITRLNQTFLRHKGPTDVITFNYLESPSRTAVFGDVVVCVDEAVGQARRFRSTWQYEVVRYIAHGVLHLLGYDDQRKTARRKMQTAEEDLIRYLASHGRLSPIGHDSTLPGSR